MWEELTENKLEPPCSRMQYCDTEKSDVSGFGFTGNTCWDQLLVCFFVYKWNLVDSKKNIRYKSFKLSGTITM